jgi:hypothetical protein
LAGEGVLAVRARAAGAAVPAKTPLTARAATVMTAAAATTAIVHPRRMLTCRSIHSLTVVARTRPHDGSAAAEGLPETHPDGPVPAGVPGRVP